MKHQEDLLTEKSSEYQPSFGPMPETTKDFNLKSGGPSPLSVWYRGLTMKLEVTKKIT